MHRKMTARWSVVGVRTALGYRSDLTVCSGPMAPWTPWLMSASRFPMKKTKNNKDDYLREYLLEAYGPEVIIADGLSDAFVCVVDVNGHDCCVYDRDKVIGILMKRDKMDSDMACEHFEFNIAGAKVGPGTPLFINTKEHKEVGPFKVN